MTTELTRYAPIVTTMDEAERAAKAMAASGFFADAQQAAQALVKILAGQEMGFGPFASMTNVHIIKGKPTLSANLMAAAVKRTGRYNYRVLRLDDTGCDLAFYEGAQEVGRSSFDEEDARKAGLLTKDTWRQYPRNLYFARAMSNGTRWYAPDALGGAPAYTPEEISGEIIEGELAVALEQHQVVNAVTPVPGSAAALGLLDQPEQPEGDPDAAADAKPAGRPYAADVVKQHIAANVASAKVAQRSAVSSPGQRQMLGIALADAVRDDGDDGKTVDAKRHSVMAYLVSKASSTELTWAEASALIGWLNTDPDLARAEAHKIVEAHSVAAGQNELPL